MVDEESLIEAQFDACFALVNRCPGAFTVWERGFLRDAANANETAHLTPRQVAKLAQIYDRRVLQGDNT
jgi:hypothetical protein